MDRPSSSRLPRGRTASERGQRRLQLRAVRVDSGERGAREIWGMRGGGRGIRGSGGGGAAPQAAAQPQVVAQLSLRGVGLRFVCWGPLGIPQVLVGQWSPG